MYDDLGLKNASRLLVVAVDEAAREARLVWEHRLDALSAVFGDADPTPAGNVVGSYWRQRYGAARQAEAGVLEVVREPGATRGERVAWHLRVFGRACASSPGAGRADDDALAWHDEDGDPEDDWAATGAAPTHLCASADEAHLGWKMYSVERFYDGPLIAAPTDDALATASTRAPRCARGALSFVAFDSYKSANPTNGSFVLARARDGATQARGDFFFAAHWRPTTVADVAVVRGDDAPDEEPMELVVTNARGRSARHALNCTWS